MSVDDVTLVRRCLRGDAEAVRTLVERFQAEVFGLCVRLLHHRHDAEDVSQEVFLRVFRSLRRLMACRTEWRLTTMGPDRRGRGAPILVLRRSKSSCVDSRRRRRARSAP